MTLEQRRQEIVSALGEDANARELSERIERSKKGVVAGAVTYVR